MAMVSIEKASEEVLSGDYHLGEDLEQEEPEPAPEPEVTELKPSEPVQIERSQPWYAI